MTAPRPSPYDVERSGGGKFGFAYDWLITPTNDGAIAYFGEVGIAEDWMGAELESYLLLQYQVGNRVLGSIYMQGERSYCTAHRNDNGTTYFYDGLPLGEYRGPARFYLGWMTFFGDPSLRMQQ